MDPLRSLLAVVRDAVRTQLWPIPALAVLVSVVAGLLLPHLDESADERLPHWLDALSPGGRLIFPLTSECCGGGTLKVTRGASTYAARFVCPAFFVPCAGARSDEANRLLEAALGRGHWQTVHSLRRDHHALEAQCWLHGEGYCISTRDPMDAAP